MSGLTTSVMLGLIAGQGCAISLIAVLIVKSWKRRDALPKLVAMVIAYFVWLGFVYALFVEFGDRISADIDREALVLAWPITAVIGAAVSFGLWLAFSKMKALNRV